MGNYFRYISFTIQLIERNTEQQTEYKESATRLHLLYEYLYMDPKVINRNKNIVEFLGFGIVATLKVKLLFRPKSQ